MAKKLCQLDLAALAAGSPPGITPAMGQLTAEAAAVLLEHNKHASRVRMTVEQKTKRQFSVTWPALHKNAKRTHRDLPEAVEQGAYGIAFLLVTELTKLKVVERSAKKTGIDFWLGTGKDPFFQNTARLEVSGIINDADAVKQRVKDKAKQAVGSQNPLPAYVAVVEFGQPYSVFKKC